MSHMNATSPRISLVKGERYARYELVAVMAASVLPAPFRAPGAFADKRLGGSMSHHEDVSHGRERGWDCPRTGAKNCVEEPKFNDDGNWW